FSSPGAVARSRRAGLDVGTLGQSHRRTISSRKAVPTVESLQRVWHALCRCHAATTLLSPNGSTLASPDAVDLQYFYHCSPPLGGHPDLLFRQTISRLRGSAICFDCIHAERLLYHLPRYAPHQRGSAVAGLIPYL